MTKIKYLFISTKGMPVPTRVPTIISRSTKMTNSDKKHKSYIAEKQRKKKIKNNHLHNYTDLHAHVTLA